MPLLVSETSTEGNDRRRVDRLDASVAAVARLRAAGLPVRGYTWWPLFDFVAWSYASGGHPIEEFWTRTIKPDGSAAIAPMPPPGQPGDGVDAFLRRMGAWRLAARADGTLDRVETALVPRLRTLAGGG